MACVGNSSLCSFKLDNCCFSDVETQPVWASLADRHGPNWYRAPARNSIVRRERARRALLFRHGAPS